MIHPSAKGFATGVNAYEKGRPEYPSEAIDFLIQNFELNQHTKVLDLGAETGKFTRLLVKSNASIFAIEPIAEMRKKFSTILPSIEIKEGTAEKIPLKNESVDVVVIAQAFHWFNAELAIQEIFRVLKPNGKLALIWNARNENIEWVSALSEIINQYEKETPRYRNGKWKTSFDGNRRFSSLLHTPFSYNQIGSKETILNRVASISFIAALPSDQKADVLNQVSVLLEHHPQTKGLKTFVLPYRTDVFTCQKLMHVKQ